MGFLKDILKAPLPLFFTLRGKRPWSLGYIEYKEKAIRVAIEGGPFDPKKLQKGYGFRIDERIVEYPWFFSRLPEGAGRLLDAGSVLNFDFILSHKALSNKKVFISTLAPEARSYWDRGVSYVYEDLRETCFRDSYFDWVASLSTIEHIGLDNTLIYTKDSSKKESDTGSYLLAVKEMRRVLKPKGALYISLPFGRRANCGWFQVFDGAMVDEIKRAFSPSSSAEFYFKYDPDGWRPATRGECGDAECFDTHGTKSSGLDAAAFSRAIVCMELIK